MGANSENICEAFALLADLAKKDSVSPLNKLPGCWERQIGNQWWIAVNGHREPMKAGSPNGASAGDGIEVQPFHAYVEFNGWPAGHHPSLRRRDCGWRSSKRRRVHCRHSGGIGTTHALTRALAWNDSHRVGVPVNYLDDSGKLHRTATRSEAYVLSGHTAVIFVDGQRGCVALNRVMVRP